MYLSKLNYHRINFFLLLIFDPIDSIYPFLWSLFLHFESKYGLIFKIFFVWLSVEGECEFSNFGTLAEIPLAEINLMIYYSAWWSDIPKIHLRYINYITSERWDKISQFISVRLIHVLGNYWICSKLKPTYRNGGSIRCGSETCNRFFNVNYCKNIDVNFKNCLL